MRLKLRLSVARSLLALALLGTPLHAEDPVEPFAEKLHSAKKACETGDLAGFKASMQKAWALAIDGKEDLPQLRTICEFMSAYPVITSMSTSKDIYLAWFDTAKEALAFPEAKKMADYSADELAPVLQAQSDIALLLLRTSGNPFLDGAKDSGEFYKKHLAVVGIFLGGLQVEAEATDRPVNLYQLTPEALQALTASGEPFLSGGDPEKLQDAKARELVQRDYAKNRQALENFNRSNVIKRTAERVKREALESATRLIDIQRITKSAAVTALISQAFPRAVWEKSLNQPK